MKKHAYLIMAHNEWGILEKILKCLDHENVDFYIHIDKKAKDFDFNYFSNVCNKSNITFTNRINVIWGSDSQIKCELLLLKEATKHNYDYYHLISGMDMPLKSIEDINLFFESTSKDYIKNNVENNDDYLKGIRQRYFLQQHIGRGKKKKEIVFKVFQRALVVIQRIFKVDRVKKSGLKYFKGDQWFSITDKMAKYIIKNEKIIKKYFYNCYLGDEIVIATIAYNSPYKENIENDSLRYIDWSRGQPYTFTSNEYGELMNCNKLFARKFSYKVDKEVIEKIYNNIMEKKG